MRFYALCLGVIVLDAVTNQVVGLPVASSLGVVVVVGLLAAMVRAVTKRVAAARRA